MLDAYNVAMILGIVAVAVATLYVLERRSRQQPVDWVDLSKLVLGTSAVTGGVVFSVGDTTAELADAVLDVVDVVSPEMFVGKPGF